MNKTFLTAVSAIAIMGATPAFADTNSPQTNKTNAEARSESSTGSISKDAQKAWENTKKDVSEAAEDVSEAAEDAYNNAKQALNDDDNTAEFKKISIDSNSMANNIIGQPVYDTQGSRVAKVHDIILDKYGNAEMVILVDGDFTGLGKLVAFQYDVITTRSEDGDIVAALNEKMIDTAASFSYEDSDSKNVRVMPKNGHSVSELLDGKLVTPEGETLANVENLVFRNGQADMLVVSFDQTLGLGGEKAAISFADTDLDKKGDSTNFKLSVSESSQFKQFKKTVN
ncbi:MAG: hypothetical protein GC137_09710 [Alphaproteobacteria bacterium]|nr:hypothetical protein [Alphaproteobacteria bacterium]